MISIADGPVSFQFSTDELPARDRSRAVRELHESGRLPGKLEPLEPLPDHSVRADFTQWTLPGLGILTGTLGGVRQQVSPQGSYAGDDNLFLAVNVSGASAAMQGDSETRLRDGDAFIATRGNTGFTIIRPRPVRFIGLRMPRAALAPLVIGCDEARLRLVPHSTGALTLLTKYVGAATSNRTLTTAELRRVFVTHVYDLAALTVGATRDAAMAAEGRGVRAARLQAIKSDIAASLADCELSAAAIAARHHLTPRYIHKLFESEGLSFSQFVLDRRLALVHRMLTDPRFADRSISSIAFDVGFGDLSYFNRAFRRRYEATPSDVRAKANLPMAQSAF
jgi:AraC-like DNA-binding protein